MKIAIIGNSGSGKSTLARRLAARYDLAVLDLDTVAWEPEQIAVPRAQSDAEFDVKTFCDANDAWVVEGCYTELIRVVLSHRPFLFFLEPGAGMCLSNCQSRPWEPHKYRSKEEQDEKLEFLLSWVREYYTRDGDLSLASHQSLFDEYAGLKEKLDAGSGLNFASLAGTRRR
jgi:adenylate kinase family enzyme